MAKARCFACLALLAVASAAGAHGPLPDRVFDPLTRAFTLWLTPTGLSFATPDPAFAPFETETGADARPLSFELDVPVPASLAGGARTVLYFRAEGTVVPRAPDGMILEVATSRNGESVEGSSVLVRAPETPLQPGKIYELAFQTGSVSLPLESGGRVGVQATLLGQAAGAAGFVLGPQGSTVGLTFFVSSLDALGHDHQGWSHFGLQDLEERRQGVLGAVLELDLHHGTPEAASLTVRAGTEVLVRIVNAETPEEGATHGPWGLDHPHVVRVEGPEATGRISIDPSEVLERTIRLDESGALTFDCTAGCTRTGVFAILEARSRTANATEERKRIEPGQFHEINLELLEGEVLRWSFRTDPPREIYYDVHSHPGGNVVTHSEGRNSSANGTFTAPESGVYSILFQNLGSFPVDVLYSIEGGSVRDGSVPRETAFLPGEWLAPALLALTALLARSRRRVF